MDDPLPPRPVPVAAGLESVGTAAPARRQPATVPAGNGIAWWREGWRLFAASPGIWIAITVLFVVIMIMLAFIPILGTLATTVLVPVLVGGVLSGCRAVDRGSELAINHLFASFSDRLVPLIIVGLLYLAGSLAIMIAVLAILVAAIGMSGIGALFSGDPMQAGFAMIATFGIGAMFAVLLGLLLGVPLMMACWFAPALVVFRNDEPWAAMKASFDACLVNVLPMLIYSLLGIVFAIVASFPLFLGWLVLFPVFAGSIYASYKDIFGDPGGTPA
jgi:uncharacterized membrane protein